MKELEVIDIDDKSYLILKEVTKDSTIIIVTQRVSTILNANQIIVLDEGKVTGIGTHDELIENNAEYQEIYYSQMDKKEAMA